MFDARVVKQIMTQHGVTFWAVFNDKRKRVGRRIKVVTRTSSDMNAKNQTAIENSLAAAFGERYQNAYQMTCTGGYGRYNAFCVILNS